MISPFIPCRKIQSYPGSAPSINTTLFFRSLGSVFSSSIIISPLIDFDVTKFGFLSSIFTISRLVLSKIISGVTISNELLYNCILLFIFFSKCNLISYEKGLSVRLIISRISINAIS